MGLDTDLSTKLILKTHFYINEFVKKQPELMGRGLVGDFRAADAPVPVITTPVNPRVAMGVHVGPTEF